ncbi:hypothetical protein [Brucella anthropi]|uniref:hypothetical protein n=1 Tax=Brucella anthropi TaxID=529 RepID=UPI000AE4254E|nr:hypothetical protein [Brucella anthropi]
MRIWILTLTPAIQSATPVLRNEEGPALAMPSHGSTEVFLEQLHIRNDIPTHYGSNKRLSPRDLEELTGSTSRAIQFTAETLLTAKAKADTRELTIVKPWLHPSNRSDFYRHKFE